MLDVPADDALVQVRLLLIRVVAVLEMVHQVEALDGQAVFMERKVVLEPVLQVYVESIRTRHMRCSHVHKLSDQCNDSSQNFKKADISKNLCSVELNTGFLRYRLF